MTPDLTWVAPFGILLGLAALAYAYLRGSAIKTTIAAQTATIAALQARIDNVEQELSEVTAQRDAYAEQNRILKDVISAREAIQEQTRVLAHHHEESMKKAKQMLDNQVAIRKRLEEATTHD